ncbi:MAG: hypothetical protein CM15mV100_350 [uncultured marine virus]|nr:MAG: hypothetical protein CM15mV100_350 [uncultured marine virus]
MAIEPKNTREHILALYGYITGVRRDMSQIKNNHLKHMHEDIRQIGWQGRQNLLGSFSYGGDCSLILFR